MNNIYRTFFFPLFLEYFSSCLVLLTGVFAERFSPDTGGDAEGCFAMKNMQKRSPLLGILTKIPLGGKSYKQGSEKWVVKFRWV